LKECKSLKVEVATFKLILKDKNRQLQHTKMTFMWEYFNGVAYQENFHILKISIKSWQLLSFYFKRRVRSKTTASIGTRVVRGENCNHQL